MYKLVISAILISAVANPKSVIAAIDNDVTFRSFIDMVSESGLGETIYGLEKATVFAPTDDAFAKIPKESLAKLTLEDKATIVARHIVPGRNEHLFHGLSWKGRRVENPLSPLGGPLP